MKQIEIKARGLSFEAWADGAEDAPLLILLHGLPRGKWEWHHQVPKLAAAGFRVIAPDLRGYCPGARPEGVESYRVNEYAQDILAMADKLGWADRPFHLMGTSIGAVIAWRIAGENPQRILTLACINIPHPGTFAEIAETQVAEEQKEKFNYINYSKKPGNEPKMFKATIKHMGLPEEETAPYVEAHSSDEALRAVYHYYRANVPGVDISSPSRLQSLSPVVMPTLYIWPPDAANVSRETAEATAKYVEGPYRFEVLEGAQNFALQKQPEIITQMLLEHLAEHARVG